MPALVEQLITLWAAITLQLTLQAIATSNGTPRQAPRAPAREAPVASPQPPDFAASTLA